MRYAPIVLFQTAERFFDYIYYNQWPKEAAYGTEESKEEWAKALFPPRGAIELKAGEEKGE